MLTVLLPIIGRFFPYIFAAAFFFAAGSFAGWHFEYGAVQAAKLELTTQQRNDVATIAAANAIAATDLEQADARANAAELKLTTEKSDESGQETKLTTQIADQAARPSQDAVDAPVLAATLDALAGGNP